MRTKLFKTSFLVLLSLTLSATAYCQFGNQRDPSAPGYYVAGPGEKIDVYLLLGISCLSML